jgi:hypothetical protein
MPMLEPELLDDYFFPDEDMFQIRSPKQEFILDVGWYGNHEDGTYMCCLVEIDDDRPGYDPWTNPIEIFKTRRTADVWQWLSKTVSDVHRKLKK